MSPTETVDAKKDGVKREISVEIPAEEVAREMEVIIQKYQKVARLPGFRSGHVPASIIKQRFKEDLKSDVVEALVPRYFRKEAEKLGMIPVSQPRVTDLHIHDGEPLRFKASFEVLPEIVVEGYKELRADHPEIVVKDEEVEEAVNSVREQHATYTSVEGRALADGDFAQASMDGRPKDADDKTQPVHMDEVLIEIGGKNTVPEFTENLRGANAGDEREFEVSYPEDVSDKRLAGKTFIYTVKIQAIKQKNLPELNDDFAKELGEFTSLDQVRKQIRENMQAERKHDAEREAKDKLVAELVKRNDFEVPESLVDRQIDRAPGTRFARAGSAGHEDGRPEENGPAPLAGGPAGSGGAGCKVVVVTGTHCGSGKNRSWRGRSKSRDCSPGSADETDSRSGPRSFDTGWGPR